jgi:hypothetical protein
VSKNQSTGTPMACKEAAKTECHGDMRKFAFLQRCWAYRKHSDTRERYFDDLAKTVTA